MPAAPASRKHYRLGALYSIVTAALLATQEPFSALAAKRLAPALFVCLTQAALLLSVPLLISSSASRRDFIALLATPTNYWKLAVLFVIGLTGLLLYNAGLSNAHPIIIAAILNLSPLWAAAVALLISKKPIPVSPGIFFGCLAIAFIGAMTIAWSQASGSNAPTLAALAASLRHTTWFYAIPIPILFALSGTLVGHWFGKFDPAAAIAANFVVSATILIPATVALLTLHPASAGRGQAAAAIVFLIIGTLASAAAGRVLYQVALAATKNDNGFVTMFFLTVPGLTTLISIPLSWWIPELRFVASPLFFSGLALVAAPLLFFSVRAWR
ncbi:MAG TPA: hypothetical protein VKV96_02175 [Roseiarcus sp.]|nr:hypothetical protein [Roseiarcus sp.]